MFRVQHLMAGFLQLMSGVAVLIACSEYNSPLSMAAWVVIAVSLRLSVFECRRRSVIPTAVLSGEPEPYWDLSEDEEHWVCADEV